MSNQLSDTNNVDVLWEARKWVSKATDAIYEAFLERQRCMQNIADAKVQEVWEILEMEDLSVIRLQRETELLHEYSNRAIEDWEDPEIIKMLIWYLMYAWKMKQLKILKKETVFWKEELRDDELLKNLVDLTKRVSSSYNVYWKDFDWTALVRYLEKEMIRNAAREIWEKWLAIDLWTANWDKAKYLKSLWFKKVIGYDISPDMIEVAKESNMSEWIDFSQVNLFEWIPLENASVDYIVSNFWSASEVHKHIFKEVDRVLKPWWKAYLSFYNQNSITSNWWQPLQGSIWAVLNKESHVLEVPIFWWDGVWAKVYQIYAMPYSLDKINSEVSSLDLHLDSVWSFSPALTLAPSVFFDSKERLNVLKWYEKEHCFKWPYLGFYIMVVVKKK